MSLLNPPVRRWALLVIFLLGTFISRRLRADEAPPHIVNVILWFDTEDYLLPADDDAAKRLAEMLTSRGVRATFKVVGEKARVLQQRGRTDVIDQLKKHEIGYHSNLHSVHPAPTEYLAECGLLDGIAEFVRHEKRGAADVRRVFGVPSLVCYGQPGSSWAPQAIAALGECGVAVDGVPCYVDSGSHVQMDGRPFWYAGALMVYGMSPNETRMDLFGPEGLPKAQKQFAAIADRLAAGGGGLISIYYHPCEWVHERFWDDVNFRRGANPPREEWRAPPQISPEKTEAAFERFGSYVDFMRSYRGIHFVTARDLPALYPDALRSEGASEAEVLTLAKRVVAPDFKGLDDQVIGNKVFSPAEQFELLALAVGQLVDGKAMYPLAVIPGLLGPDGAPPMEGQAVREPLRWAAFRDSALDARDYLNVHHRIPSRVFIGADAVAPADFATGLAAALVAYQEGHHFPETVALGNGVEVLTERRVAKDVPGLFGGWIIHRANFRAPKLMEIARLQAWTLKPAKP
jgi:hypothetical protein